VANENPVESFVPVGTEGHSPGTNHAHGKCRWIVPLSSDSGMTSSRKRKSITTHRELCILSEINLPPKPMRDCLFEVDLVNAFASLHRPIVDRKGVVQ